MAMQPVEPPPGSGFLLRAPIEVIRQLKNEPLLLAGVGAACLITFIAFFLPDTGRFYAWLIAGLVAVLCVLRAFTEVWRVSRTAAGKRYRVGSRTEMEDVALEGGTNLKWRSGRRSKIKGLRIGATDAAVSKADSGDEETRRGDSSTNQ